MIIHSIRNTSHLYNGYNDVKAYSCDSLILWGRVRSRGGGAVWVGAPVRKLWDRCFRQAVFSVRDSNHTISFSSRSRRTTVSLKTG